MAQTGRMSETHSSPLGLTIEEDDGSQTQRDTAQLVINSLFDTNSEEFLGFPAATGVNSEELLAGDPIEGTLEAPAGPDQPEEDMGIAPSCTQAAGSLRDNPNPIGDKREEVRSKETIIDVLDLQNQQIASRIGAREEQKYREDRKSIFGIYDSKKEEMLGRWEDLDDLPGRQVLVNELDGYMDCLTDIHVRLLAFQSELTLAENEQVVGPFDVGANTDIATPSAPHSGMLNVLSHML